MGADADSVSQLAVRVARFRDERDWRQFHTPKDLAISISVEAAELLEVFQWKPAVPGEQLKHTELQAAGREIADVAIYLLSLCDVLGLQLGTLILNKLSDNERKYPTERAKGHAFPP
jgi:dCTP diphosphatase